MHKIRIVEKGGEYDVETKPPSPWCLFIGWHRTQTCSSLKSAKKYAARLNKSLNSPKRIIDYSNV